MWFFNYYYTILILRFMFYSISILLSWWSCFSYKWFWVHSCSSRWTKCWSSCPMKWTTCGTTVMATSSFGMLFNRAYVFSFLYKLFLELYINVDANANSSDAVDLTTLPNGVSRFPIPVATTMLPAHWEQLSLRAVLWWRTIRSPFMDDFCRLLLSVLLPFRYIYPNNFFKTNITNFIFAFLIQQLVGFIFSCILANGLRNQRDRRMV